MLAHIGHFASSHPGAIWPPGRRQWHCSEVAVITVGPAFTSSITAPASESSAGLEILASEFRGAGGDSGTIVFSADQGVTDPAVETARACQILCVRGVA